MRVLLSLLFSVFITANVPAQINQNFKTTSENSGMDYRTSEPVPALRYTFMANIYEYSHDAKTNTLRIILRDSTTNGYWSKAGALLTVNATDQTLKWTKDLNFRSEDLSFNGNLIFLMKGNNLHRINEDNGEALWVKRKERMFASFPQEGVGLTYNLSLAPETLIGVDLATGKTKWTRTINSLNWEHTNLLPDSNLLIASSGIHTLDLKTGKGWDLNRITTDEKMNNGKAAWAMVGGVAFGALGGAMIPYGMTDLFMNISSNVLYDGDEIYYAGRNKISRIALADGKTAWSKNIDGKISSKSFLFKEGNTLYMINMGYALNSGQKGRMGKPYVAAFDADTGEQLFLDLFDTSRSFMLDYELHGGELRLLFDDRFERYEYSGKGLKLKGRYEYKQEQKPKGFVSRNFFSKKR